VYCKLPDKVPTGVLVNAEPVTTKVTVVPFVEVNACKIEAAVTEPEVQKKRSNSVRIVVCN